MSFTFSIISSLTLAILFVMFQAFLLISLLRKSFCGINGNRMCKLTLSQKSVQVSAIGAFFFFGLSAVMIIMIRLHDLHIEGVTDYFACITMTTRILYQIFMYLGYNCSYIFMFSRLYATFEDSDFKVTKKTIYIHIIVAVFSLFSSWTLIALAKVQFCHAAVLDTLYGLSSIPGFIAQIYLVFSFNYRLFKMAVQSKTSVAFSPRCDQSHTDHHKSQTQNKDTLNEKQRFVLAVVRKHTILGIILLLTMFVILIDYLIAVNIYATSENHNNPLIQYPHYLIFGTYLDATCYMVLFDIIHVLCLCTVTTSIYLGFSTNKSYYQYLCDSIDLRCKELCESLAGAKVTGYGNLANDTEVSETAIDITMENTTEISL